MKTIVKFAFLFFVLHLFTNCGQDNDDQRIAQILSLRAAIAEICINDINFEDLDDNVYGYRADDIFGMPSVQAGGHSDADELTDLGINMFLDLESLSTGNYSIEDGSGDLAGTAYVFYFPGDGSQYISTANNTGNLVVEILEFREDGTLSRINATFNNVEVANIIDPDDKLCINAFDLFFTL